MSPSTVVSLVKYVGGGLLVFFVGCGSGSSLILSLPSGSTK